jgi:spermidine synthase
MIDMRELVARRQSEFQDIAIVETTDYGRALFLDGLVQSAAHDEHRYHEFLVHPAIFVHGAVRQVLVAGAGEGASLRELLKHPGVESILAVDIDPLLVEMAREHLPTWHRGAFDDPRVVLRIEDIRDTLETLAPASLDLAILDLTDPVDEHQIANVDASLHRLVSRALRDDGLVVMQFGELDEVVAEATRAATKQLGAVFDWVEFGSLFLESFDSRWGFAFAAKTARSFPPPWPAEHKGNLATPLRAYDATSHADFWLDRRSKSAAELGCA